MKTVFEYMSTLNEPAVVPKNISINDTPTLNLTSNYIMDLNTDASSNMSDWFQITSHAFKNQLKFPILRGQKGEFHEMKFGTEQQRLNDKFQTSKVQGATTNGDFWFKIKGGLIYYFATKEDINILGSILVESVTDSQTKNKFTNETGTCLDVIDYTQDKYELCTRTYETKMKWYCSLQSFLKQTINPRCYNRDIKANVTIDTGNLIEVNKTTQPIIIIPLASKQCNEKWDYANKGNDWECECSEGREQSPIDLPSKDAAILSNLRPLFQYDMVQAKSIDTTIDGSLIAGEYIKIRYDGNAIRIHHPNLGKIVALDGGVFQAEEIVFHTPSEHQINGEKFDMEMQVIHYGKSKGDIAKQIILSFLFKARPGVYNKFIDKLDFFNLPNPTDEFRDITNDLYIPQIFYTTDDDDIPTMKPFSFYTYEGSITSPPCTERTTHYVAADPIEISSTVVQLFKEALKKPDMMSESGDKLVLSEDGEIENNRKVQPLNGRSVFIFDHIKFNCPEFKKIKRDIHPKGHYEKREIQTTQYIFVNGPTHSGIPGAFVVSENEAKGTEMGIIGEK
jgi:carbonic anhydrase